MFICAVIISKININISEDAFWSPLGIKVQSFYKAKAVEKSKDVLDAEKAERAKKEIKKTLGSLLCVIRFCFGVIPVEIYFKNLEMP